MQRPGTVSSPLLLVLKIRSWVRAAPPSPKVCSFRKSPTLLPCGHHVFSVMRSINTSTNGTYIATRLSQLLAYALTGACVSLLLVHASFQQAPNEDTKKTIRVRSNLALFLSKGQLALETYPSVRVPYHHVTGTTIH